MVLGVLAVAPGAYSYSNQGFAIAGHVLETAAGTGYEELLATRVLRPLGISTAGPFNPKPTSLFSAARTLNATGQYRVTLLGHSLR